MNSYKKLMDNSFIFAVGNLGSKLISFLLVPLYTYYLSTEQYGTVDLVSVTVTMLVPIVSASIFQSIFRFIMDKDKPQDVIMTNSIFIAILGLFIAYVAYPILSFFNVFESNLLYLYLILTVQIFERIFSHYARAIGKIKIYAANGILLTLTTGIFNILFLVHFGLGVNGYFLASIVSHLVSVIFLVVFSKAFKDIKFSKIDKKSAKELLTFSLPLIPSSVMWWLVNTSSRYFILFFAGVSANGLFAVASKIPSLINLINNVFTQAWQISAIEEYKSENQANFYTKVFTYLSSILFIGTSALIGIIKVMFDLLFESNYYIAWQAAPFLILGTVFASFASFLEMNYIAAKQTNGVLRTSFYGGIISIILNFILIPACGIVGAGMSSMISFFAVFIIRFYDTKQYVNMEIKWSIFMKNLMIILSQIAVLMFSVPKVPELIIELSLFMLILVINRRLLLPLMKFTGFS